MLEYEIVAGAMVMLLHVTKVNKLVQGSLGSMQATKKEKLHVHICQVDGTEWAHTLWPIKFCLNAAVNLFPLTCKLSQGKIKIDHKTNVIVHSSKGNIILDIHIMTCDGWIAIEKFLQ